ncbi:triokinase/FMN cyclase-like isoform X1 [Centruroides vittatus]|uniref:triokinase/FMN cyclase-like isoform X1 n=1 Tax=Centruroides vittatus TaxID=120091 RepID=UPI00350FD88E
MDDRKKLINSANTCVRDSLKGFVAANVGLRLIENANIVVRHDLEEVKRSNKVTLISGGGSGHEPAMAGYVGSGMLTACVQGEIFTSPPAAVILNCIRIVAQNNPAGTLVILLNYTGDRLNFGLAVERARIEGLLVDTFIVNEDCALVSKDKTAGRRGLCGAILIYKIAGAMAEEGRSLCEIKSALTRKLFEMGTIGISLSACSTPSSGKLFKINFDEMELGLGIHGEAGISRLKVCSASEVVHIMFNHMTREDSASRLKIASGNNLCLVVNNLGGLSQLEMNIMTKEAVEYLENIGAVVTRVYCGTFITSLEMAGVSLTVFKVDKTDLFYLDDHTEASSWIKSFLPENKVRQTPPLKPVSDFVVNKVSEDFGPKLSPFGCDLFNHALQTACQAIISSERQLNELDKEGGDGDCGSTLKRGAEEILSNLNKFPTSYPKETLFRLAHCAEISMGGCSGGLYGLLFTGAAQAFETDCSPKTWCQAINLGVNMMKKYGEAEEGDRTMLDALIPACASLHLHLVNDGNQLDALGAAVKSAETSAATTAELRARAGRASYVNSDLLKSPDPGAHAVGIWMRAVFEGIKQKVKALPK